MNTTTLFRIALPALLGCSMKTSTDNSALTKLPFPDAGPGSGFDARPGVDGGGTVSAAATNIEVMTGNRAAYESKIAMIDGASETLELEYFLFKRDDSSARL